ncbi:cytochrome P450 [Spirillospora sp. NPDC048819]|uniref:cytochrome P450 n=1 Tax=Spirillospora sp. NPDC048819 TaxID=3155268 RepID=UPI0033FA2243
MLAQEPLSDLISGPEFVEYPYDAYRRLTADAPVYRASDDHLLVCGFKLCQEILTDSATFGQRPAAYPNFHSMDPPEHTRLRRLVSHGFSPRAIRAYQHRIEYFADQLLTGLKPRGRMNLIKDFALPLPTLVITEMLGVPYADGELWEDWANAIHRHTAIPEWVDTPKSRELVTAAAAAATAETEYFRKLVDERRRHRGEDLISVLVAAEEDGDRLSEEELLYTLVLLLGAGHHTSVNLIGNGMRALLAEPAQFALLRARPDLIDNAVEEMLRIDPPLQVEPRKALRDTEIAGEPVPAGTLVHCILAAANRDPAVFDDPDRFDVARPNAKRHLAFSMGIHHCLGAPLARAEGRTAVRELLSRLDGLRLDGDSDHDGLYRLRGLADLPVAWTV